MSLFLVSSHFCLVSFSWWSGCSSTTAWTVNRAPLPPHILAQSPNCSLFPVIFWIDRVFILISPSQLLSHSHAPQAVMPSSDRCLRTGIYSSWPDFDHGHVNLVLSLAHADLLVCHQAPVASPSLALVPECLHVRFQYGTMSRMNESIVFFILSSIT